jgi:DNA-binding ferritin-like protein (Dps family)
MNNSDDSLSGRAGPNGEGWISRLVREKREWRAYVRRVKALPPDYQFTLQQIEKFMWNFASDGQVIQVFEEIADLFEDGARRGQAVLEITGEDVAGFCQAILAEIQAHTWTGKKADDLNRAVHQRLNRTASHD